MSEHSKQWLQPVTTELTKALEGVRTQAGLTGNQQYVLCADTYISALASMTPHLFRWFPDPVMTAGFIRAAAVVGELYRQGNIPGVFKQSYAVLSALPGDPGSTPPVVPPPPDDPLMTEFLRFYRQGNILSALPGDPGSTPPVVPPPPGDSDE